ncbi:AEC family transporter [Mycoplasma sp. P36-A1]|uniref:AEC family transporter n=1 Tax=Mycoplasma sp. P36-A1 TaxID=3252900 RepID=UPI003C30A37D
MHFIEIIQNTMTNKEIIGAISSTLLIIMLGYYLRYKDIFSDRIAKTMSDIAMQVALPCMAFNAFMQDINDEKMKQGIYLLLWGFVVYFFLIIFSKVLYFKFDRQKEDVLRIMTVFGSATFYGTPICAALYGPIGVMYSSIYNIGYRAYLYSYGVMKMSGLKFEKKNFKQMVGNPVLIATILGMIIWWFQNSMPQISVLNPENNELVSYGILRIDQSAYWLYKPMTYLASLASPLAWMSIGATLGSIRISEAASNKISWLYTFNKLITIPIVSIFLLFIGTAIGLFHFDAYGIGVVVIMAATPAATITASLAISYDKEALLASNATLISTVVAVILTPVWIILIDILANLPFFK